MFTEERQTKIGVLKIRVDPRRPEDPDQPPRIVVDGQSATYRVRGAFAISDDDTLARGIAILSVSVTHRSSGRMAAKPTIAHHIQEIQSVVSGFLRRNPRALEESTLDYFEHRASDRRVRLGQERDELARTTKNVADLESAVVEEDRRVAEYRAAHPELEREA